MNTLPEPEWVTRWRGVDVRVFATGDDSPLPVESAAAVLSDDEHQRASRFHFQHDRERWMRSRALLRMCLGDALGMHARALEFLAGEFGKPELMEFGDGMSPPRFNLSHSGDFAAVALSKQPVGVDIECWKPLPVEALAVYAFRPEEHAAVMAHSEPQRLFLELWTAKEAVMKCTGQGLSLPPASVIIRCGAESTPGSAVNDEDGEAFVLHSVCHPGMWMLTAAQRA